jgi:hypothetical protein
MEDKEMRESDQNIYVLIFYFVCLFQVLVADRKALFNRFQTSSGGRARQPLA